jgi:hypothetical protein
MGMSILGLMRPDDENLAVLVHVLGAMILVGGVITASTALLVGWRDEAATAALRLGYFALLAVALPGYIVMRIGAEWAYAKGIWDDLPDDPAWVGVGYIVADGSALLLLIALIVGGIGVRRLPSGGGRGLLKASTVIALILIAAYVIAVWAMAGKLD